MTSPYATPPASPVGGDIVPVSSSRILLERTLSKESQRFGEALIEHSKALEEGWFETEVLQSDSASVDPEDEEEDEEGPWTRQSVLCLDGGGVWGYSSLLILATLMREIEKLELELVPAARTSGDSPLVEAPKTPRNTDPSSLTSKRTNGYLPCHYFDYIAGTSTGGLIAIMLGRLQMSVEEVMQEYELLTNEIFTRPRHTGLSHLSGIFRITPNREILSAKISRLPSTKASSATRQQRFESDSSRCKTIVCSMERSENKAVVRPFLFRSYNHLSRESSPFEIERNPGEATSRTISEVAQATIPMPQLVPSVRLGSHKYFDAGLGLNNPSSEVYNEVYSMHRSALDPFNVFLSLGCGYSQSENGDARPSSRAWTSHPSKSKLEAALGAASAIVHQAMLRESTQRSGMAYYRLDANPGLSRLRLDERRPKGSATLRLIREVTSHYLDEPAVRRDIRNLATALVSSRRERAGTQAWESFALGTKYRCSHQDMCEQKRKGLPPYRTRNELLDHLRLIHRLPAPDAQNFEQIRSLLDKGRTNMY